ncbi:protein of unknown function [Pseudorhizobium banfieldiae]|uniref:Uncharacterized protein n=1 Tax=Pseudorhizobium banfieldiae TaxID=1125847 RepID=L0NLW5_9HYPH|nr:protein of unknown function [Pseudorhizobium banfieldiae]
MFFYRRRHGGAPCSRKITSLYTPHDAANAAGIHKTIPFEELSAECLTGVPTVRLKEREKWQK